MMRRHGFQSYINTLSLIHFFTNCSFFIIVSVFMLLLPIIYVVQGHGSCVYMCVRHQLRSFENVVLQFHIDSRICANVKITFSIFSIEIFFTLLLLGLIFRVARTSFFYAGPTLCPSSIVIKL